ncbi:MAG: hypothetical protein ACK41Y_14460 [Paracoccus hibiscisoli]|uniref:hypothetical protein n=1 Tax=Paracoccus hibiscisoli TaxID=2023261 RepID=UPI00391A787C
MNNLNDDLRGGIIATADSLGMPPEVLATIISYETAGTFDPRKAGPTTQWGQHRGLIQFGEPQAREHGVNWDDPVGSQLGPDGAVARYFRANGWKPGMSELDAYSIVNAGAPGLGHRTDANNGGAPGTVSDKVANQFGPHRSKAAQFLGGEFQASAMSGYAPPSVNGTDMQQLQDTPLRTFRDTQDDAAAAAATAEARPSLWDATKMAVDEGWVTTTAARQLGRSGFEADDNFQFSPELWDELAKGLPVDYQKALGASVSEAHARVLADQTRKSFEIDQKLGNMGWGGMGLRLGAAMLDPVAIGVSIASEGAAAPFIYGAKIGKIGRFLRGGAAAAATNAGIEGYLISQSPLQQWEGIGYAAAAGFALGGGIAALRRTPEDAALMNESAKWVRARDADDMAENVVLPNNGSVGAARATPLDTANLTPGEIIGDRFKDAPLSALGRVRYDMVGVLKQNDNPVIRQVADLLAEDAVGNANGSVNIRGASENVAREMRVRMSRFYRDYDTAFGDWAAENGKTARWRHQWDPAVRAEFNREVALAVRRPLDAQANKHINSVASRMQTEMKDLLEYGRDKNIRGFNDIKDNYNYLTRRFRVQALDDLVEKHGQGTVTRLVAESMQKANKVRRNRASQKGRYVEELEYETALDLAGAYLKSIRSRKYGDFNVHRAFNGDDMTALRNMLDDAGLGETQIDKITDAIRLKQDAGDKGRMSEAKFRMDLDETFRLPIAGNPRGIGIEDFLENDAEMLFTHYARSVIGTGEIEDAFSKFKIADADGVMPEHAPSWSTVKGYAAENHSGSVADWRAAEDRMDALYTAVAGISHEPPSNGREALRMMRDYNFSRVGGQLGVTQLAEIGNLLGNGGLRVLTQNIPSLRHIFQSARSGGFSDDLFNEIEAIWGFGTDMVRVSPHVKMDDVYGGTFEGRAGASTKMQMADHSLQRAKMVTSVASGMSHVDMALQRLTGRVLVQRFMDDAVGRRAINTTRLRALGVSDDMHPRIQAQMQKHVDQTEGLLGRKVSRINIDSWDDIDAKNAFINGVDRWSKKVIQENDPGNMPAIMTKELWKSVFQFRSFMLAAYSKQLLSGIHHRDWETFSSFSTSMFFGALFYAGQTVVNAQGRADKEAYLEKRLSPESLAKASFQRAGFSSLIPLGVDTIAGVTGFGPVFDFRSTDLASGAWGNPTWDLIQGVQGAARGIVAPIAGDDYEFSQQDYRAITSTLLFQNAFVIRNALGALGSELPRYSN